MENTFYAVQHAIDGRSGHLPSYFSSLDEAKTFANLLIKNMEELCVFARKCEVHIYEVKEPTAGIPSLPTRLYSEVKELTY